VHISSPNIDRFSVFFHCYIQQEIYNGMVIKDPITRQTCRYTSLSCEIIVFKNAPTEVYNSSRARPHALKRAAQSNCSVVLSLFESVIKSNSH